jgi:hypothetical protein
MVDVFPIQDEYRIFKTVANHHTKGTKVERRKIEMDQFGYNT